MIQELLEVISGRPLTVAQATLGDTGTRLALSLAEAEVALRRVRLAQEQIERALFTPLSAKVAAAMGQGTHDGLAQWRICLRYRAEAEARRRKALRVWLQHRNEVAMQETGE